MHFDERRLEGRFLRRDNRFRLTVELDGQQVAAHLPNPGCLAELLLPGRRVLLVPRSGPGRKTAYDVVLIEAGGRWVSLDTRLPNLLVAEALRAGLLAPLAGYRHIQAEVPFGHSRLDFMLRTEDEPPCLVEVKSVSLLVDGVACFPDAVTVRGRRHVLELAAAVESGYRAAVLFVVQRDDARAVRPYDETDPEFGRALRRAAQSGVEVYAYACRVEPQEIAISRRLPVHLG